MFTGVQGWPGPLFLALRGGFLSPPAPAIANPAALGLGGFALTTFVLSTHNAFPTQAPDLTWVGLAFFYGGLAQFAAGMWEFKTGKVPGGDISKDVGWFLLAFVIFNTYMLFWSTRVNVAVFGVFLTLEVTEILLFIGNFSGNAAGQGLVALGGWVGILTALVAWYASAAFVANSMRTKPILPVGTPIWK